MSSVPQAIASICGVFLLAGFWTPLMGILVAINEVLIGFGSTTARHEDNWIHIFLATVGAGIAMLGPGAWSIDARLFGRRRFDSERTRSRSR